MISSHFNHPILILILYILFENEDLNLKSHPILDLKNFLKTSAYTRVYTVMITRPIWTSFSLENQGAMYVVSYTTKFARDSIEYSVRNSMAV